MSLPVPWSDLAPDQTELLVAAWLVRIHPGAQRVDGSGGDGGVDVRLRASDGLHVFEIKSFHDRLTPARKRQIAKSLATAQRTQPDMKKWTLVLPIDFTPAEIKWFEQTLRRGLTIETDWIGRTALESGLAAHPDLMRSMAPGSVERRALDLLTQYQQETAAMSRGAGDGVERLQRLRQQFDLVDPDYAFDIGEVTPESTTLTVRPKDPSSPDAKPIGGQFLLRIDPDSDLAREIDDFTMYGRPVNIPPEAFAAVSLDLPGGLADNLGPDTRFSASIGYSDSSWQLRGRLVAVRGGKVLSTLAIDWTESTTGPAGGHYLAGRDSSGYVEVVMQAEPTTQGGFTISAPASDDVLPGEALGALRFLHRLRDADGIELHSSGHPKVETRITGADLVTPDMGKLVNVAEALERVQEAAGTSFPLPRTWTQHDAEMLYLCDQLLTSGSVTWPPVPTASTAIAAAAVAGIAAAGPLPRLNIRGQSAGLGEVQLMGHRIEFPSEVRMDMIGMIVTNLPQLVADASGSPNWAALRIHLASDQKTTATFYFTARDAQGD